MTTNTQPSDVAGALEALKVLREGSKYHHESTLTLCADILERALNNPPVCMGGEVEVGDIVLFMARSHPTMGGEYEVIGRVERDYKGLHAGNRYLPISGVRIIEKGQSNE